MRNEQRLTFNDERLKALPSTIRAFLSSCSLLRAGGPLAVDEIE